MARYLLTALVFSASISYGQIGMPKVYGDTVSAFHDGYNFVVRDTFVVIGPIVGDSSGEAYTPPYGYGGFRLMGMGGAYYVKPNGDWVRVDSTNAASGEANTASNTGYTGYFPFSAKVGVDFRHTPMFENNPNLSFVDHTDSTEIVLSTTPGFDSLFVGATTGAQKLTVVGGDILIDNNTHYKAKDTGGTARNLAFISTDNEAYFSSPPSSDLNLAIAGSPRLTVNGVSGQVTVKDSLSVFGKSKGVLQDSGGQVYNVKAFGADPTGVTDATSAIQAAIDALPATGGSVFFPPGDYKISSKLVIGDGTSTSVSTRNGVTFIGSNGRGSTASETVSGSATKISYYGSSGDTVIYVSGPIASVDIENLYIDCRDSAQTAIAIDHAFGSTFKNITAIKYRGYAYSISAYDSLGGCVIGANQNIWENVAAKSPSSYTDGSALDSLASGILIGADSTRSTPPALDVAQNIFIGCSFTRANSTVANSIAIRFADVITFIGGIATVAGGSGDGDAVEIIQVPDNAAFPQAIVFYGTALLGDKTITETSTWTGNVTTLGYHVGDDPTMPSHANWRGISETGTVFGEYSFRDTTDFQKFVGIGTTHPLQPLDAEYSISGGYVASVENTNATAGHGLYVKSAGTGSGTTLFEVDAGASAKFKIQGDGTTTVGGNATFNGTAGYGGIATYTKGIVVKDSTVAQITADQNNYSIGNLSALRISTDASRTITGFATGSQGRFIFIINYGSNDLVIANQSASSTAANRVITGTGANVTIATDQTATLWYDGNTGRWRILN